jgi:cytochrome c-type biogenesis protein CcmH/NrfG
MEQAMKIINDKIDRVVEEKEKLELALVDIIDEHNIKKQEARQTTRSKMNKIKKYVLRKEMCLQYAFGAIVILVAVIVVYHCIQQGNDCQHCMLLICM